VGAGAGAADAAAAIIATALTIAAWGAAQVGAVVLLGLLDARLLLGLVVDLLALLQRVVSGSFADVEPTNEPKRTGKETAERTTAGARGSQRPGKGIEVEVVHERPFRPVTAVEAGRQDGVESPSSVVMLLGRSLHERRGNAATSQHPDGGWVSEGLACPAAKGTERSPFISCFTADDAVAVTAG
jgi:hypothetical protein